MKKALVNKIFGITLGIFCALSITDRFVTFDKTLGNIVDTVIVVAIIGFVATQNYQKNK